MKTVREKISKIIRKHYPKTEAIYIFGSFGTPDERHDSDVDIAVLLPEIDVEDAESIIEPALENDLTVLLQREVDLVYLRRVSTVFQKEIILNGRRIFCRNDFRVEMFETHTLTDYQRLNEERKEILEDFFRTGKAYAV